MNVRRLISVFEQLLPIYKEAFDNNFDEHELSDRLLNCGLCLASAKYTGISLYSSSIFTSKGYYKHYMKDGYSLFKYPSKGKDLKNRIDFMESEIKSLKRLQKRGFTHV